MAVTRLEYLIERCLSRQATEAEKMEMLDIVANPENEAAAKQIIRSTYSHERELEDLNAETAMDIFQAIIQADKKPVKVVPANYRWWAIAASIIVVLGLGLYIFPGSDKPQPAVVENVSKDIPAPAVNRAMITLANGTTVYLDSVGNGKLAQVGNIKLVKLANGQIAYQNADGQIINELQYNTLSNPRGSKVIGMQLSDGTHVWLNAGSSIDYPVVFVGNERKVELKGEGYFEVAKDASKKFIVTANGITTEVLGTHFNINSYRDGKTVDITLLEGSVKVNSLNLATSRVIKPGQQARVAEQIDVLSADIDQVMAWKEGKFDFGQGTDIHIVMNQLARWYDFEVEYEKGVRANVGGKISRNKDRKKVLELLEKTGSVRFKFNQSKVIVMSP